LAAIILHAPIGIAWSDSNKFFLSANASFCRILGYSEDELQKLTFKDITHPEDINDSISKMEELVSGHIPFFSQEKRYIRKDGTIIDGKVTVSAICNKDEPTVFIAELENITQSKKAEKALVESEANYRSLINGMGESAWVIDFDGNFVDVNDAAVEMLGYCRGELLSLGIKGIDKYLSSEQVKNLISGLPAVGTQVFETVHTTKDGQEIPIEISSTLTTYNGKRVVVNIARNITEHKKAEETLRKSEERYRDLANFLPVIVFETDLAGKITFFSRRAFELTGVTPEDVEKGLNIISFVLPQEREKAIENMKKSIAGENLSANEYTLVRKDGTAYPALVRTTPIISENRVIGVRGLVIDITERKKTEMDLKESRDKLELMNEKLRVVGSLSRHDVRNKLSAVNGYTYLLKKKHRDQADIVEGLGKIEQSVAEAVKIFDFAKMYEQLGVEELTFVDLGMAVDEAVALFSCLTIKVVNDCYGSSVLADSFLRQMFYNFIDNTRKHGLKATAVKVYCEKEESGDLRLIYEDDGVGISAENKSKLFNEGFSTGGSTGFGLFFIRKMMGVYGWVITEEGEPGKGAKFVITVPNRSS